jgi:hypothetical protein
MRVDGGGVPFYDDLHYRRISRRVGGDNPEAPRIAPGNDITVAVGADTAETVAVPFTEEICVRHGAVDGRFRNVVYHMSVAEVRIPYQVETHGKNTAIALEKAEPVNGDSVRRIDPVIARDLQKNPRAGRAGNRRLIGSVAAPSPADSDRSFRYRGAVLLHADEQAFDYWRLRIAQLVEGERIEVPLPGAELVMQVRRAAPGLARVGHHLFSIEHRPELAEAEVDIVRVI